jgi:CheY-like chemotaxis protein
MDRILIIDDELPVIETLKAALDSMPFEIITTQNPEEGLKIFRNLNPFLIILDINMQPINGVDFIQKLIAEDVPNHRYSNPSSRFADNPEKSEPTLRDADFYVAVLTGVGSRELMNRCRSLGVEYFLNKPIHLNTLRKIIENIHHLKTARDAIRDRL